MAKHASAWAVCVFLGAPSLWAQSVIVQQVGATPAWGASWVQWSELRTQTVVLGPGLSVERLQRCWLSTSPGAPRTPVCTQDEWSPVGFSFGARAELSRAYVFAANGQGALLAATEEALWWTDDLGLHWQQAHWNGVRRPRVLAFSGRAGHGYAAAGGAIHWTEDGGKTWRFVRELPGKTLVQGEALGEHAVFLDELGGAWAALDGGARVTVMLEGNSVSNGPCTLKRADGALLVADANGHAVQLDDHGQVQRVDGSSGIWWGR